MSYNLCRAAYARVIPVRAKDPAFADIRTRQRVFLIDNRRVSALLAALLVLVGFGGVMPVFARLEAPVPTAMDGARSAKAAAHRLCFHGPQGELVRVPPAGEPCS